MCPVFSYFFEYRRLQTSYKKLVHSIQITGIPIGLILYWFGWTSFIGIFVDMDSTAQVRETPLTDAILIFIGLPIALWIGQLVTSLIYTIWNSRDAEIFCAFAILQYPKHWIE